MELKSCLEMKNSHSTADQLKNEGMSSRRVPEILAYGSTYRSAACRFGSDALSVKVAAGDEEIVAFGMIARGIGPREIADVVSATAIKMFSDWFVDHLRSGDIGIMETDQLRHDWGELHLKLKEKVRNFASSNREEVDVQTTNILINTSSGLLCLLDTAGVGVYRIGCVDTKPILMPDPLSSANYSYKPNPGASAYETIPQWISASLKSKKQRDEAGKDFKHKNHEETETILKKQKPIPISDSIVQMTQVQINEPELYLICTGEIVGNSSHEALAQHFHPNRITSLLPLKMRLEGLVRHGGLQTDTQARSAISFVNDSGKKHGSNISYNMGSAIIFRLSQAGVDDA
jgi:hypothetical protein